MYECVCVCVIKMLKVIGVIEQSPCLFTGSIKDNIRYGRLGASDADVVAACKDANAHGFIQLLPNGYDTIIDGRDTQLSGGERQRLGIARALLKNPRILLLDEATNALDQQNEDHIRDIVRTVRPGRTLIIVSHRLDYWAPLTTLSHRM